MRVQEFDNLANWFKENVLDVPRMGDESHDLDIYEERYADTDDINKAHSSVEEPTEAEDELSLMEYIIGVDGMGA